MTTYFYGNRVGLDAVSRHKLITKYYEQSLQENILLREEFKQLRLFNK